MYRIYQGNDLDFDERNWDNQVSIWIRLFKTETL
jgi:hypothetical protein